MFFHPRKKKKGRRRRRWFHTHTHRKMDKMIHHFFFTLLILCFFCGIEANSLIETEEWQKERKKKGKSSGVISNFYVCLFCALMFENEGNWKTIKNFSVKTIFFLMSLTFRLLYNSRSSSSRLQRRQNNHLCVCTKKNKKKIHCKTNKIRKKKSNKLCLNS